MINTIRNASWCSNHETAPPRVNDKVTDDRRLAIASGLGRYYKNSSPQWIQVLNPTPAKLYCLQDGH
jgi:hypothetical protein